MTRPRARVRYARELLQEERRKADGEMLERASRLVLRLFAEGRLVYRERVMVGRSVALASWRLWRHPTSWTRRATR